MSEKLYETKDSGHRREFETGAVRDRAEGKGRFDLISPFATRRLAQVYERGAKKYSDRNFELGIPLSAFLDSAMRHLYQVLEGKEDEDHAAQALWNIINYIHTQELIKRGIVPQSLDDLPSYEPVDYCNENDYKQKNKMKEGWLKQRG